MSFEDKVTWYEGQFQEQLGHGQGKSLSIDGEYHEGAYVKGLKEGLGSITFKDGNKYDGMFADN